MPKEKDAENLESRPVFATFMIRLSAPAGTDPGDLKWEGNRIISHLVTSKLKRKLGAHFEIKLESSWVFGLKMESTMSYEDIFFRPKKKSRRKEKKDK